MSLRRVVVDSKYGNMWGGWSSNEVNGSHGVGNIKRAGGVFKIH
jgi:hypothetical protein